MKWLHVLKDLSEGFAPLITKTQEQIEKSYAIIDHKISRSLRRMRRRLFVYFFQLIFFSIASICLFVGGIMFIARFVALDLVLLVAGFIALYLGFLLLLLR